MHKQHVELMESIYREHKDHIYNYIHRMCNDPQLSQDVVQTTFVKLMASSEIANVEHKKAYLFTIARNTLFDEMKRKKPVYFDDSEQMQEVADIDDDVSLQSEAEEKVLAVAVDKAIINMPDKFRELMLLRYTEDLTIQEIADVTGRNLSDIKVNLHRARLSFENRFTATMYSKVAATRKRCDVLVGMIAPFDNKDIPMGDIPRIEMHIANCVDCNDDASEMKRRRELFALLPILVASGLWEDIMKEAQASTITQSARENSSHSNTSHSNTNHSNTNHSNIGAPLQSTAKVTTTKLVSIAVVMVVLVVVGYIVSKQFDTEVEQAPVVSATPQTSSQPTPQTPSTSPVQQQAKLKSISEPKQKKKITTPKITKQPKPKADDPNSKYWVYSGPPFKAIEEEIYETDRTVSTVYVSQYGWRDESNDGSNGKIISITNFEKRKGWMVNPSRKIYVDLQLDDKANSKLIQAPDRINRMSNIYDTKPCRDFDVSKKLGTDTIAGRSVEKWGCEYAKTRQRTIQWFDPDTKLILAEENVDIGKNITQEITMQLIDKTLFDVPKEYKEVNFTEFVMASQ